MQAQIDKAYLYLCAGDTDKALPIIKRVVEVTESYDALSVFLLTLHQRKENISSISTQIERYGKKVFEIDKERLFDELHERIKLLEIYGLTFDYDQIYNNIESLLNNKYFCLRGGQRLDKMEFEELNQ